MKHSIGKEDPSAHKNCLFVTFVPGSIGFMSLLQRPTRTQKIFRLATDPGPRPLFSLSSGQSGKDRLPFFFPDLVVGLFFRGHPPLFGRRPQSRGRSRKAPLLDVAVSLACVGYGVCFIPGFFIAPGHGRDDRGRLRSLSIAISRLSTHVSRVCLDLRQREFRGRLHGHDPAFAGRNDGRAKTMDGAERLRMRDGGRFFLSHADQHTVRMDRLRSGNAGVHGLPCSFLGQEI